MKKGGDAGREKIIDQLQNYTRFQ